jgi:hypothetical protein
MTPAGRLGSQAFLSDPLLARIPLQMQENPMSEVAWARTWVTLIRWKDNLGALLVANAWGRWRDNIRGLVLARRGTWGHHVRGRDEPIESSKSWDGETRIHRERERSWTGEEVTGREDSVGIQIGGAK